MYGLPIEHDKVCAFFANFFNRKQFFSCSFIYRGYIIIYQYSRRGRIMNN